MAVEFEQDPLPVKIDERWLKEYADLGIDRLRAVLDAHARFLDWCDAHPDEEDED